MKSNKQLTSDEQIELAKIISWAINMSKANPEKEFIHQAVNKIAKLNNMKNKEKLIF